MNLLLMLLILWNGNPSVEPAKQAKAGPPVIVYKTRKNYNNKVPVLLSDDKTKIISYPDPLDVRNAGNYPVPTKLKHGYLLDNRGIGLHVAFLKMTYKQYAKLHQAPSLDSMYNMIIDKDPLTELCNCGSRYSMKDPVKELNAMILNGDLRKKCMVGK